MLSVRIIIILLLLVHNSKSDKIRKILLMSSLKGNGNELLSYARNEIELLLRPNNVTKILLIPYASLNYFAKTKRLRRYLEKWNYHLESINDSKDPIASVRNAQAIFISGGNTFILLKELYERQLVEPIREQILKNGVPYLGSSAGANVATRSIHTTNDMPIVYPPSFSALNLVPFNINPHYEERKAKMIYRSETRDQRIHEFLTYYQNLTVCGLRDGNILFIDGMRMTLLGSNTMKYFINKTHSREFLTNSDLSFLLN